MEKSTSQNRTIQQNKALHKWFAELATELNNRGLDMRTVLKPTVEIPWDTETVKNHLWRPVQKTMLEKNSTTELTTAEVNKIYEVLDRHLLTKFHINMPFPSADMLHLEEYYEANTTTKEDTTDS